jgi:hypothetical protein
MDRTIVYPGSIPLDTDLLQLNRNTMIALGALMKAVLGTATVADGLVVSPTTPNSMSVSVGPGSITAFAVVDTTSFGSLPADSDGLVKMGVNLEPTTLTMSAPTVAGQSVAWLIEAAFVETDTNPIVLPYYNASNPAQPWLGPANAGTAQPTSRVQQVQIQALSGVAVATGNQVPPPVDAGWAGLAVVTLTYGQSTVGPGDIVACTSAPLLPYRLPQLRPGFTSLQAFTTSGAFLVPNGVTQAKVTVIGGGAAGGTGGGYAGGGGGAGGKTVKVVTGLTPGATVPVTVGAGGAPNPSTGSGGNGGTSSFGTYCSATGGQGGAGGTPVYPAGGPGGMGIGGDVNFGGSYGTDGVVLADRGGDGGGPGGGRGATGIGGPSFAAPGYGGGGGGSEPSSLGGAGGSGLVLVEW